jgi:hypothetical protein
MNVPMLSINSRTNLASSSVIGPEGNVGI